MSDTLSWKNLKTGLLFTLGIVLTGVLILVIGKNTSFTSTKNKYHMFSHDIEGLAVGNFVSVAGKKVGVVTNMEFERRNGAIGVNIEMEVVSTYSYLITDDALAVIKAQGVLGDRYIDIVPGSGTALPLEGELKTLSEPGLDQLMTSARMLIDSLRFTFGKINRGEGTLGRLLIASDPLDHFNKTLLNLEKLTADLAYGKGPLRALLSDEETAKELVTAIKSLSAITSSLEAGKGTAGKMLVDDGLYLSLSKSVIQLESVLKKIEDPNGTFGKLLADSSLYHSLNETTISLDSLLIDLKRNPGRYVQLKLF